MEGVVDVIVVTDRYGIFHHRFPNNDNWLSDREDHPHDGEDQWNVIAEEVEETQDTCSNVALIRLTYQSRGGEEFKSARETKS